MKGLEKFKKISDNVYALKYPNGEVNIVTVDEFGKYTGQIIVNITDLKNILKK